MASLRTMNLRMLRVLAIWAVTALFLTGFSYRILGQSKPPAPNFSLRLELKSDPKGADLNALLRDMYRSIKEKAQETMPRAVLAGEQGAVIVHVEIQSDGSLASPAFPKIVISSGNKVIDDHAINAIRKAAPFDHLPTAAPAPVEMQLSFYYNALPRN